jgi:hypothetical protein
LILALPAISPAVNMTSYFPLNTGNSWAYQMLEYPMTITIAVLSGTVNVNGTDTKIIESSQGIREYFTNDVNGIRKHRIYCPAGLLLPGMAVTMTFIPPFTYFYAQMETGNQASTNGSMDIYIEGYGQATLNFQGTSTFEGLEIITVPAGTFSTVRLKAIDQTWGTIAGENFYLHNDTTFWYAHNVGLIKQRVVSTDGIDTDTQTLELTHTNIPLPSFNSLDFTGDRRTDLAIYRESWGAWIINPSGGGTQIATGLGGGASDIPVPGDYDGDGKTDIAIYRADWGAWYIQPSGGGGLIAAGLGGAAADIPVPGDYDGDGKTDIAIFREGWGAWFIQPSGGGSLISTGLGAGPYDTPVSGDYDGDGKADVAIYRADWGAWIINPSGGGAQIVSGLGGGASDVPVPGDYDGDGKTDIAIYRADWGAWYIQPSGGGSLVATGLGGGAADVPVPGDYDGDGKTDIAIYRANWGAWIINPSGGGAQIATGLGGGATDIPITSNLITNWLYSMP